MTVPPAGDQPNQPARPPNPGSRVSGPVPAGASRPAGTPSAGTPSAGTPSPAGASNAAAVGNGAANGAKPRHAAEPSIGELVHEVTTNMSTLVHSEIELAKLEVRSTVKNAGTGAAMFIAALVVLFFSLTFGLIALAEGLVTIGLWRWAAYLIVFGLLVLLVALLVLIGIRQVKKAKGAPKTIATSKETVDYLRGELRS